MEFRKGIDLLLEAIPYICENKNAHITIVGDGIKKDDLLFLIDQLNLHDQVKLIDFQPTHKIADIMRSSDILVNTSLTESFCMVVLEAAMCGLKVVTTNVGGISELKVKNSIFFCEPTGKDIAKQIFVATETEIEPATFEKNNEYFWLEIAQKTLEVYESIEKDKNKNIFWKWYEEYSGASTILFLIFALIEFLITKRYK